METEWVVEHGVLVIRPVAAVEEVIEVSPADRLRMRNKVARLLGLDHLILEEVQ